MGRRMVDWSEVGRQNALHGFRFAPPTPGGITEKMTYAMGYIEANGPERTKAEEWVRQTERDTALPAETPALVWEDGWPYSRPRR